MTRSARRWIAALTASVIPALATTALAADEEFTLPAEGYVPYKYVFLRHKFEHDTWVQDVQILPSNPRVVHHCNMYTTDGKKFGGAGFVTGKVPGGLPMQLADGLAFKMFAAIVPPSPMLACRGSS